MKKLIFTIFGILFLIFLFLFWGGKYYTDYSINSSVNDLRNSIDFNDHKMIHPTQLQNQPELIKKFFRKVLPIINPLPNFVYLELNGKMKTKEDSEWLPYSAKEYYTTNNISFISTAEIKNSKFFWVNILDRYIESKGNTQLKINSSINIGDSEGIEIDKSNLFKYLSHAVYFPMALFPSKTTLWNILDTNIAEIKFTDNATSIVAKIFFNINGTIYKIETMDKYIPIKKDYKKANFMVTFSDYQEHNSFLIPLQFEIEWELNNRKFKFGKFEINKIDYE